MTSARPSNPSASQRAARGARAPPRPRPAPGSCRRPGRSPRRWPGSAPRCGRPGRAALRSSERWRRTALALTSGQPPGRYGMLRRSLRPVRSGTDKLPRTQQRGLSKGDAWDYSTARPRSSPAPRAASAAPPRSCSSAEGAQVTINDIDGDIAEQAAGEIKGETVSVAGDLTKPGACDEVVQKTVDAFGKVDILVNNAGYTWDGAAHKMSDEQFQAMLDIHTVVPFRMVRAVAPAHARAREGRARRRAGGVSQDHQHHLDLGHDGQRRPGQLLVGQGRGHRPHEDARQGVGPVQDQRQRGRVRIRRDAADAGKGEGRDRSRPARVGPRSRSASPSRCATWPR